MHVTCYLVIFYSYKNVIFLLSSYAYFIHLSLESSLKVIHFNFKKIKNFVNKSKERERE